MLTLAIIKPDAVAARLTGKILAHLEQAGFAARAARFVRLTTPQAEAFYAVHRERPFFRSLVTVRYQSAPGIIVGQEDATLESK